jgi:hypothetical protein
MRGPDSLPSEKLWKSSPAFHKIKHEKLRFGMFGIGRRQNRCKGTGQMDLSSATQVLGRIKISDVPMM